MKKAILFLLVLCTVLVAAPKVVCIKDASSIDKLAVKELCGHLKQITGEEYTCVEENAVAEGEQCIFVGLSDLAKKRLGTASRLSEINEQGCVVQGHKGDLFLYGKGRHGNLYAVYEYLENKLGCRWLTAFDDVYVPKLDKLTFEEGASVVKKYGFTMRSLMNWFYLDKRRAVRFEYRNRQNLLLNCVNDMKGVEQYHVIAGPGVHVLNTIMPGFSKNAGINAASKLIECKDYFAVHPEWFSLDENGKRVNTRQLCFSNPELRKELTKNALIFHKFQTEKNGKSYLTIDLNDIAYNMCRCENCAALQKKYNTPGAPFFDFMAEICNAHPEIEFVTLAYQRSLTQHPPVGYPNFPKNLTIIFCPINGLYSDTFEHGNQADLADMQAWTKLAKEVWLWYYPNTYTSGGFKAPVVPPIGNFERIAEDIRTMAKCNVTATYFEHDAGGITTRTNLSEMQSWVMFKLFENPDRDVQALKKDFAEHYYGKAANMILQFANELEAGRKDAVAKNIKWYYNMQKYHYLTPENLVKWNKMFDDASAMVDDTIRWRLDLARAGLDCACVEYLFNTKYTELVPVCLERLKRTVAKIDASNWSTGKIGANAKKWYADMEARRSAKPIPEQFKALPEDDVKVLQPNLNVKSKVNDEDANCGVAVAEDWNGQSFAMGTYDYGAKTYGPSHMFRVADITKGEYKLYLFAKGMKLTPGMILFGGKWTMNAPLRNLCSRDDLASLEQKWDCYVSLKFTDTKVLLDRVIMVKQN